MTQRVRHPQDSVNPFQSVLQVTVLMRPNGPAQGGRKDALNKAMNTAYKAATPALSGYRYSQLSFPGLPCFGSWLLLSCWAAGPVSSLEDREAGMLHGNMLVGVWKDSLIVRLGPDAYDDALLEPNVREFDITGKPMKGWVMVEPEGVEDDEQLKDWIERAIRFVKTLPKK